MVDTKEEAYSLAKDIKMSMVTKPALNMLEVFLPDYVTKEFNEYVDGVRESAKSFSHELVGQIKSNEKSAQLDMNFEDKPVKGLKALLEGFTHSYLSFLGCADAKSDCVSMWTVHSYEGDYNPLHDHGVNTPTGMSCILYLKVPPQIEKLSGSAKEYETGGLLSLIHI